ncbi:MAG: S8/S53 family peptidase [Byssovorax sp.]
MKNSQAGLAVASLAMIVTAIGCHPGGGGSGGGSSASSATSTGSDGTGGSIDTVAVSCPGNRWIGKITPGETCPASPPGGPWVSTPLFGDQAPKGPLAGYCLYEWGPDTPPDATTLPSYKEKMPLEWLDRDCAVVAPLSDASDAAAAVIPTLSTAFLAQIEAPTSPVPVPAATSAVRVAIIDAWPSVDKIGSSPHGAAMAGLVEGLTCDALGLPACTISAVPELTLNLLDPGQRDNVNGGYFGFQGKLARSVYDAVTAWQAEEPTARLVLNLSLGWDKRFNTTPGGAMSAAVSAANDALVYAACQGALIFVAAGNTTGGPTPPTGPTYPAAWETQPAPIVGVGCPKSPGTGPLLHAVGGVDGFDARLPNSREGGRPVLAAPAFMVPSSKKIGASTFALGPFTGSSVSSAVASAVAAAVWHYAPGLSPVDVAAALRTSGEPLLPVADFCLGALCPKIHRISLCRALQATSFPMLVCPTIAAGTGKNAVWTAADLTTYETHAQLLDASLLATLTPATGCSTGVHTGTNGLFGGPSACPTEQYEDAIINVALTPQPGCTPCPACQLTLDKSGGRMILDLQIDDALTYQPTPMVLALASKAATLERYDLYDTAGVGGAGLKPGSVYQITLPATSLAYRADFQYATIEWLDDASRTQTTSALLIVSK